MSYMPLFCIAALNRAFVLSEFRLDVDKSISNGRVLILNKTEALREYIHTCKPHVRKE